MAAPHPGGAPQATLQHTLQLRQLIDRCRALPGFVLAGAATVRQRLDPDLVRDGRFDLKVRVGDRQ